MHALRAPTVRSNTVWRGTRWEPGRRRPVGGPGPAGRGGMRPVRRHRRRTGRYVARPKHRPLPGGHPGHAGGCDRVGRHLHTRRSPRPGCGGHRRREPQGGHRRHRATRRGPVHGVRGTRSGEVDRPAEGPGGVNPSARRDGAAT